jgi:hypothetical protein
MRSAVIENALDLPFRRSRAFYKTAGQFGIAPRVWKLKRKRN